MMFAKQRWILTTVLCLSLTTLVGGCAGPCSLFVYCAFDRQNPPAQVFTIHTSGDVLVGGQQGRSMASKALFPAGHQTVMVGVYHDRGDDEEAEPGPLVPLMISGGQGDEFVASCFQYNGAKVFGLFPEVLYGVEITNRRTGSVVARHPTGSVQRRSSYC